MGAGHNGHFIAQLAWDEVARRIAAGHPAILPIGAAAKQHGFHLPLDTDRRQAEWFAQRLAERIGALIWPTVTYGYYPAFVEYAGSVTLSCSTFEAMVHEIAAGILDAGCTTLFVLNTGISTLGPVERAVTRLANRKVHHLRAYGGPRYTSAMRTVRRQSHGSHADEFETSLMLAIAPELVDMTRAEASPAITHEAPGLLTPTDPGSPNYSRSGSYGDPTLATLDKGKMLLGALLEDLYDHAANAMGVPR